MWQRAANDALTSRETPQRDAGRRGGGGWGVKYRMMVLIEITLGPHSGPTGVLVIWWWKKLARNINGGNVLTQRAQQKRQRAGADGHPESESRLLHKSQHSNSPSTGSKHTPAPAYRISPVDVSHRDCQTETAANQQRSPHLSEIIGFFCPENTCFEVWSIDLWSDSAPTVEVLVKIF